MSITFALDVYGTLIDPLAIGQSLEAQVGEVAPAVAELWRSKQLEYSFRRGLMCKYKPFPEITRAALDYACDALGVTLSEGVKAALMKQYRTLDAFDEVVGALESLKEEGAVLHAFSNGIAEDVASLLKHNGIDPLVSSIVSVDAVKTFKPDPRVYAHFNRVAGSLPEETWLVSSNPFDIIGASACGWQTAWIRRSPSAVFDPWDYQPTRTITSLTELMSVMVDAHNS